MPIARDIMNKKPPYCALQTPIKEIARRFASEHLTGLLVIDEDEHIAGIITESDLLAQQGQVHIPSLMAIFDIVIPVGEERFEKEIARMQALTAVDLMSEQIVSVAPDAAMSEVVSLMIDKDAHHIPVLDEDLVVGLISKHEVICALAKAK